MKNADAVKLLLQETVSYECFCQALREKHTPGVSADTVQEKLGIVRNNASTLLNQGFHKKLYSKITTRPVSFVPRSVMLTFCEDYGLEEKGTYALEELLAAVDSEKKDPFDNLLGHEGSLKKAADQAKAAIVYPPKGLHTLILGESGVGKTTFAAAMHAYGMHAQKKDEESYPFVTFNCADYYNNPQLLLSQLFGHTRNAFTGATEDKAGLVEKANGGILFLDEVHRLPPEGQEMLFYLMDKGEFNRLGENTHKRKVDVLIVCATTENPENNLLTTFMRRIPVSIYLPRFADKPVAERVELIEYFFHFEALNLKQPVTVAPEVLKAMAIYGFPKGNIGQLRSEIKLLCAHAFLESVQYSTPIHIDFSDLNANIRECLFHTSKLPHETKNYLKMFTDEIIIQPDKKQALPMPESSPEIYTKLADKYSTLRNQGLSSTDIQETLQKDIESYFQNLTRGVCITTADFNNLYKFIPKQIVDTTVSLIDFAHHHLQVKFKDKFIFGFCFHIQALLQRTNSIPELPIPPLGEIERHYPRELQIATEMIRQLENTFRVKIRPYERGFLAMLLAKNEIDAKVQHRINVIICCHGEDTATSIAKVVNTLLNTSWMKALDMPLDADIDEIYQKFRSMAISMNRGQGLLFLVDMGSLAQFGVRLQQETGIVTKVIPNISTPLALELLRKVLYKTNDLDSIYQTAIHHLPGINTDLQPAILSLCMTGEGASKMAYELIEKMLPEKYKESITIIVEKYLDIKNNYPALCQQYHFVAIVGNIDPQLDIPFFQVGQLLSEESRQEFLQLIGSNTNLPIQPQVIKPVQTIEDKAVTLLDQYVKFVNPKVAITHIKNFVDHLDIAIPMDNQRLDLYIHLGCMLDRCIHQDAIYFDNIRSFIHEHQELFTSVRKLTDTLAQTYDTTINDDEVCYIIKIILSQKSAK